MPKRSVFLIKRKVARNWDEVDGMGVTKLIQQGLSIEKIMKRYSVSYQTVIHKLRFG